MRQSRLRTPTLAAATAFGLLASPLPAALISLKGIGTQGDPISEIHLSYDSDQIQATGTPGLYQVQNGFMSAAVAETGTTVSVSGPFDINVTVGNFGSIQSEFVGYLGQGGITMLFQSSYADEVPTPDQVTGLVVKAFQEGKNSTVGAAIWNPVNGDLQYVADHIISADVPEPASLAMGSLAAAGTLLRRRRMAQSEPALSVA